MNLEDGNVLFVVLASLGKQSIGDLKRKLEAVFLIFLFIIPGIGPFILTMGWLSLRKTSSDFEREYGNA